jgi:cyclase
MLKTRVIPTLLWKDHGLVKGTGFDSWRRVGPVMPAIKVYNLREVDELIIVDIRATGEAREPDYAEIAAFSRESSVPTTVGGGVADLAHIRNLLLAGADKVAVNSAAYADPELVSRAAGRFGAQCVVVSIDFKTGADGRAECYSHSGSRATGRDPVEWARFMEKKGAGEILLTSVDRDGTMTGYDLEITRRVSDAVNIPVIASGGAGSYEDMYQALNTGRASAVAAASIFHFTELTPLGVKNHLASKGVPVRKTL